jgi:hypothetical protein
VSGKYEGNTLPPAPRSSLLATRFTASGQTSVVYGKDKRHRPLPHSTQVCPVVVSEQPAALGGQRAAAYFFLEVAQIRVFQFLTSGRICANDSLFC